MNKYKQKLFENRNKIKELIRTDTWCTAHVNCFRSSFHTENVNLTKRLPESMEHIRTKFERYLHWRTKGFQVLTEARLKSGLRPDLICYNSTEMFIEEIINTEKEDSIIKKKKNYPLLVVTYKVKKEVKWESTNTSSDKHTKK